MQLKDEEPYFHDLRSEELLQSRKMIIRMATMMVWSHDVGGVIGMADIAETRLTRSKSEKPVRKKTPFERFISTPGYGSYSSSPSQ